MPACARSSHRHAPAIGRQARINPMSSYMKFTSHLGALAAVVALLAGCGDTSGSGGAGDRQAPADSGEGAAAQPPTAFLQCRACHSVEPGRNGIGPSLAGIAGKPAASVAGFRYSSALQTSGIVWSRDRLDEWLSAPPRMVPGTRMMQAVRSVEQRKAVIDYLETLQ